MPVLKYNQIICCSSEKSATTGMPGFGVRAKSSGLTNDEATEIYLKSRIRYSIPVDRMVTADILKQTPNLDTIYPHIYVYNKIQLYDERNLYLIGRVMYVGAEYGFFEGSESNNRVGSNYISHILVFAEMPTMNVVSELMTQKKFLPQNTLCSFSNEEFARILKGDSFELPMGEINIGEYAPTSYSILQRHLLVAMLQAYVNEQENNEIVNIIAKINSSAIEETIISMGAMPSQLTDFMYFNANILDQSCVPEGMRLIFTNEKDDVDTLDEYHIVIDALCDQIGTTNINDNYLFDRIKDPSIAGDVHFINKIANLYINLSKEPNPDYENAYKLLAIAVFSEPLSLNDMASLRIEMIEQLPFIESEKAKIWSQINHILKESFVYPCGLNDFKSSLDLISKVLHVSANRLEHIDEYAYITNQFLFETADHFNQILENYPDRLSTVLLLFDKTNQKLISEDSFYNSLLTTTDIDIWHKFLLYYYKDRDTMIEHMQIIVGKILESENTFLANCLFPVAEYFKQWIQILNACPKYTVFVKENVSDVLQSKSDVSPQELMDYVLLFNDEVMSYFNIQQYADAYANALAASTEIDRDKLNYIHSSLTSKGIRSIKLDNILDILNEKIISNPTYAIIQFASKHKVNQSYVLALFETWIKNNTNDKEIVSFVTKEAHDSITAAQFINIMWSYVSMQKRESILVEIFNNLHINSQTKKEMIELVEDEKARELLKFENTLISKLFRKLFKFRFVLLMLFGAFAFISCNTNGTESVSFSEYVTPFLAEQYGDSIGVSKVCISEYDSQSSLISVNSRGYNYKGKIEYAISNHVNGNIDTIVYIYSSNGKLIDIKEKGFDYRNFRYNNKGQLIQYIKSLANEDGFLNYITYNYFYNSNNKVEREIVITNKKELLYKTEFSYIEGKVHTIKKSRKDSLTIINFNHTNGTINSIQTSHSQEGNDHIINYNYEEINQKDDTLSIQKIVLSDKKRRHQGHLERITYLYDSIPTQIDNKILTDYLSANDINASDKDKTIVENNFITNYINNITNIFWKYTKGSTKDIWLISILLGIFVIVLCFYCIIAKANPKLKGFLDRFARKPNDQDMQRLWLFYWGPYIKVSLFLLILIAAFLTAIIVYFIAGAIAYFGYAVSRLIVNGITMTWVIVLCVAFIIYFLEEGRSKFLTIVAGILIYNYRNSLHSLGEPYVNQWSIFMDKLSIFKWCLNACVDFGHLMLAVFAITIFCLLAIILAVFFLIYFLRFMELAIMKIYHINRPCPICASKKEKEYWADRIHKHPVRLQPSIYGIFSHTEPQTKIKLPTLLFAGKSKVLRKCPYCGNFITSLNGKSYGTEKHIGIAGYRTSGKTFLTYTLIDRIIEKYGASAFQIDSDSDTKIEYIIKRIHNNEGIQTDLKDSYRAIQLIVEKDKSRIIPYHLFFYDVAGEKYELSDSVNKTAMEFYSNANQIIFVIDPTTIDFSKTGNNLSEKMKKWVEQNTASEKKYSIDGVFSTIVSLLNQFGRKTNSITFLFLLVKADRGYLEYCGYNSDLGNKEIKAFIQNELGLNNIISSSSIFKTVEYEIFSVKQNSEGEDLKYEFETHFDKIIEFIFNH